MSVLPSVGMSVSPYVSALLLLDGFVSNLILDTCKKICRGIPSFVKFGQKHQDTSQEDLSLFHCVVSSATIYRKHCYAFTATVSIFITLLTVTSIRKNVACPWQRLLHERATLSRYTHISYVVKM